MTTFDPRDIDFRGILLDANGMLVANGRNYSTDAFNSPGELSITQFSPETISALKNALGYGDVIVKCGWCGQYGAVKTTCQYCGRGIDPR